MQRVTGGVGGVAGVSWVTGSATTCGWYVGRTGAGDGVAGSGWRCRPNRPPRTGALGSTSTAAAYDHRRDDRLRLGLRFGHRHDLGGNSRLGSGSGSGTSASATSATSGSTSASTSATSTTSTTSGSAATVTSVAGSTSSTSSTSSTCSTASSGVRLDRDLDRDLDRVVRLRLDDGLDDGLHRLDDLGTAAAQQPATGRRSLLLSDWLGLGVRDLHVPDDLRVPNVVASPTTSAAASSTTGVSKTGACSSGTGATTVMPSNSAAGSETATTVPAARPRRSRTVAPRRVGQPADHEQAQALRDGDLGDRRVRDLLVGVGDSPRTSPGRSR